MYAIRSFSDRLDWQSDGNTKKKKRKKKKKKRAFIPALRRHHPVARLGVLRQHVDIHTPKTEFGFNIAPQKRGEKIAFRNPLTLLSPDANSSSASLLLCSIRASMSLYILRPMLRIYQIMVTSLFVYVCGYVCVRRWEIQEDSPCTKS